MFYYIRYLDLRKLYLMQCKQKNVFLSVFFSVSINSFTGRSLAENGLACLYLEISAGICMNCALG
jgi:hypothetical protein